MVNLKNYIFAVCLVALVACSSKPNVSSAASQEVEEESKEAKALLQGIWINEDTEEVSFRALGDTIYYPDTISQPTYFKIVKDSLVLGSSAVQYPIVKQMEHVRSEEHTSELQSR